MLQHCHDDLGRRLRVIVFALLISALPSPILGANAARPVIVNTAITNSLTRYLTNVIEVFIPNNVFVDEFRTNWVRRDVTNVVDLYQTNVVLHYRTNVLTVDRYVTNFVTAWQTNVMTLTVTNWNPVTVITTNVVSRPIAGPTEIPQPTQTSEPALIAATSNTPAPKTGPSSAFGGPEFELELTSAGAPSRPGEFPVRLTLLSAVGTTVPVSEWRVENLGGGGLMVSAKSEFSTVLPVGVYRVTARIRGADGTVRNVRGDIEVKTDARAMRTPVSVAAGR